MRILNLDSLIGLVLEQGSNAAEFPKVAAKVGELEPADQLIIWLRALSKNPDLLLARLQLAKLYWQLECLPFSLEQLQLIYSRLGGSPNQALKQLIQKLGGTTSEASVELKSNPEAKTLASVDFDIEVLREGKE